MADDTPATVHMSHDVHPEFAVCGINFTPSVKRSQRRDAVTCEDCLAMDSAAMEAARKPLPWGGA